jgi:hypothetical protein
MPVAASKVRCGHSLTLRLSVTDEAPRCHRRTGGMSLRLAAVSLLASPAGAGRSAASGLACSSRPGEVARLRRNVVTPRPHFHRDQLTSTPGVRRGLVHVCASLADIHYGQAGSGLLQPKPATAEYTFVWESIFID